VSHPNLYVEGVELVPLWEHDSRVKIHIKQIVGDQVTLTLSEPCEEHPENIVARYMVKNTLQILYNTHDVVAP
jgi:hypothetical protein